MTGRVHSFQSLGTVDGPGIRFVVFLQGCPLRCKCCHNPDTWDPSGGTVYTAQQVAEKVLRYQEYFGTDGGITVSGGEPLLQAAFCREVFALCKENGINTCLDTSGFVTGAAAEALLAVTDRVLLDIKYTNDAQYRENVGMSMEKALDFLALCNTMAVPVTLRQVIIPTVNDTEENAAALGRMSKACPVVDKVELLPFRTLCQSKYDEIGIPFPFGHLPTPTREQMEKLEAIVKNA